MLYYYQLTKKGTTKKIPGKDIHHLADAVSRWRKSNGFGNSDYNIIYNELKVTHPKEDLSLKGIAKGISKIRQVTVSNAWDALKASTKIVKGEVASQKEIDRRSEICLKCPMAVETSDCRSCSGTWSTTLAQLTDEVRNKTGVNFRISDTLKAKFCGVCGCTLMMLIASLKKNLHKDDEKQKSLRPEECWMNDTTE